MKKIIAIMLATVMLFSFAVVAADTSTNSSIVMGDVDGDGKVTISDALEILKYIVGLNSTITNGNANISADKAFRVALITGKESPVINDALQILRYLVGMRSVITNEVVEVTQATQSDTTPMPTESVSTVFDTTEPVSNTVVSEDNNMSQEEPLDIVFVAFSHSTAFEVRVGYPRTLLHSYNGIFIEKNGDVRVFSFENITEHWAFGGLPNEVSFKDKFSLNETESHQKLLTRLIDVSEFELVGNISELELNSNVSLLSKIDTDIEIPMMPVEVAGMPLYVEFFGVRHNFAQPEVVFISGSFFECVNGISLMNTSENAVLIHNWINEIFAEYAPLSQGSEDYYG